MRDCRPCVPGIQGWSAEAVALGRSKFRYGVVTSKLSNT
jgi:hypothetical protein